MDLVPATDIKILVPAKISFSAEEKKLLVSLLKNENIIENKRTNKSTNKLKADAWERIKKKYNNHAFVTKRETIQLRRCWEKIKRLMKDARSKEIQERMESESPGSPTIPKMEYVECMGEDEEEVDLMNEIPGPVDRDTNFSIETPSNTEKRPAAYDDSAISQASVTPMHAESPSPAPPAATTPDINYEEAIETSALPPRQSTLPNLNSSVRRSLAPTTASDIISMRRENILKEREQQHHLYLLRRSLLETEHEETKEKLRHLKKVNRTKEILELERLKHQRAVWKIELELALGSR